MHLQACYNKHITVKQSVKPGVTKYGNLRKSGWLPQEGCWCWNTGKSIKSEVTPLNACRGHFMIYQS